MGKPRWVALTRETGLKEWVCRHGVGHPDYMSAHGIATRHGHDVSTWLTHGCDGCCSKPSFPGWNETVAEVFRKERAEKEEK